MVAIENLQKAGKGLSEEIGALLFEQRNQSRLQGTEARTVFNERVLAKIELRFKDVKEKAHLLVKKKRAIVKTIKSAFFSG
ncbi:MAG TPA: hypothetical protein VJC21_02610 [Candidatus Nanoarchaeia archaeon]|uniref:Uncharacterized protein n=1 Tax=Candidatus Harrisonbacteria bacterium RIFCSPLOWO2_02_FULL_45_10c TaxID=1798410 RepID=A0A1G1ZRK1_9BACT|nr:MAG: hypothetical protein A3H63_02770 [Candidatus Harrisonbacteria bacterium RIFCSPLOWO2_02_FULL_45_10c]HLC97648.1 hypothetical protein [Candidatus Nanoarchaeia archaeon]